MEDNSEDQVPLCVRHLAPSKALEFRGNWGDGAGRETSNCMELSNGGFQYRLLEYGNVAFLTSLSLRTEN